VTVLVGILAKDGVVIAADRAVTMADGEQHPTIVDTQQKIDIIDSKVIVTATGSVGLGQRFRSVVRAEWSVNKGFDRKISTAEMGTKLANKAHQQFQTTGVHPGMPPRGIQLGALVAYSLDKPTLIEFSVRDFQPEHKTDECWYVSMGSGQTLADPYLALMRRSVWVDGQPSVEDATFAAYWVMQMAIAAAPGFIQEPIDVAVLRKNARGDWEAKMVTEQERSLHQNRADDANKQLKQALLGQLAPPTEAPPMPVPPAA
jgi:20S proteasome alpha/beta subunit